MRTPFPRGSFASLPHLRPAWRVPPPACSIAAPAAAAAPPALQHLTTVATASVRHGGAPFWQLVVAFVCGGVFVSTAFMLASSVYSLGYKNVKRIRSTFSMVVRRTWTITISMLGAATMALFRRSIPGAPCVAEECEDEEGRWAEAIAILRKGFSDARRTASQGVEAIKLELDLYSAQVGVPGLTTLQYIVDKLTPFRLEAVLQDALNQSLSEMQLGSRKMVLRRFCIGGVPPQLLGARAYELERDALAFDFDVSWESAMLVNIDAVPFSQSSVANIGVVPVSVRNVVFKGPVRVVVTHLMPDAPGYGALLVSLPSPPEIGLDVRIAGGEVTRVPWFRDELERALQRAIADEMSWPRRLVIPADKEGFIGVPVLPPRVLDDLMVDDPLLRAERALVSNPRCTGIQDDRIAGTPQPPELSINMGTIPAPEVVMEQLQSVTRSLDFEQLQSLAGEFSAFGNGAWGNFTNLLLQGEIGNLDIAEIVNLTAVDFADLVDFAELGAKLQAGRLRFERDFSEEEATGGWWRGVLGLFGGGNRTREASGAEEGAAANASGPGVFGWLVGVAQDVVRRGNATQAEASAAPANATSTNSTPWYAAFLSRDNGKQTEANTSRPWWAVFRGEEEGKAKLDDESAPEEQNATLAEIEGAGESISTAEEDAAARKEIVADVETEAEHTLPPAHADVPVSEDHVDLNDVQAFIHSSPEDASDVNRSISATINRTTARTEAA
ncbi:hypothetical protein AB1Y20_006240 [Prymnesium parvum]|uniref:SMP-LTD domain-containing protein n=1 Tax=Prymnesium parvum TaxID=97485 RepID=A0AB34J2P1_PRYPA